MQKRTIHDDENIRAMLAAELLDTSARALKRVLEMYPYTAEEVRFMAKHGICFETLRIPR